MPTAAKLVASIMLAISGFIMVIVVVNVYPDAARRSVGMTTVAVLTGLIIGWRSLGKKVSEDEGSGINSGLKAGVLMFIWMIFLFALENMIGGIKDNLYYQPMTALLVIPAGMIKYGQMALNVPIIGTMVVFAAISGKVTKTADTRWN